MALTENFGVVKRNIFITFIKIYQCVQLKCVFLSYKSQASIFSLKTEVSISNID